ncbi:MAG: SRPBCC domain-containing protein [Actinomycetota bacterium]|nr:SRPBCC domain-containing protein [Actinomycetota bacterium]
MSDSVTRSVEVAVSPDDAFDVFTREIDAWYRVDRDTLPDITRTAAIRFEPRLGGRLLDVEDLATGEGRELGRITVWEPGSRLVFVDNEGTEIDVAFERHGAGTRVTLTHRGLDRLEPARARALRRSGWPSLAPIYRDHIAPNARPVALAVGALAVPLAVGLGLNAALTPKRDDLSFLLVLLGFIAVTFAVFEVQDRLVHGWLPSRWQYRRIFLRVQTLSGVAFAVWIGWHRAHWSLVVLEISVAISLWSQSQSGPADGQSLRQRPSACQNFAERHRYLVVLCWIGGTGTFIALIFLVPGGDGVIAVLLLAFITVIALRATAFRRRQTRTLGFDPDLFLAVGRGVSEEDRRPEWLLYQPSEQPEYSGWWAYASEEDRSHRFVAWSLKDLIDQAPEAAQPLREGQGRWRWDQANGAYRRCDQPAERPQAA